MAANDTLTAKQARFCAAVLSADTVADAAHAAGISERTAWRYLRTPAVRAELSERQSAMLAQVAGALISQMTPARDTLQAIMENGAHNAAPRVSAARALLEAGLRLFELVGLSDRVASIEDRLSDLEVKSDG